MATMSNLVTPQKGLVPVNPFLNSSTPTTGGTTTPSIGAGYITSRNNATTASPSGTYGMATPTTKINPGFAFYNPPAATGTVQPSTAQNTGASASQPPTYQQNLSKYNLTAVPAGYSFDASGKLTNNAGQEYQTPAAAPVSTGPVSPGTVAPAPAIPPISSTQGAGGTPVADLNAPNNPNTATGNTFNNAVGTEAQMASQPSAQYTAAEQQYATAYAGLAALQQQAAQAQGSVNNTPGISLQGATGESGQIQNTLAAEAAPLTGEMTAAQAAAQTATGQQTAQQQGLGQAAGLVSPTQVPYSNQYLSPTTGQSVNGGGTGGTAMSQLPAQAQSAVQSYAQQVQNGSMTRADAESRLSAYGIAGTNALNEALGPNFNTNASNASAGTTAVGQQIKTAADTTNKALDTLSSAFSSLNGFETGGIPATNSIAQWISSQFGSSALQTYKTNLADARSQLIGVLNSAGGTPTGNEATANQYLPDNMTKAQFDANVGTQQNPGIVRQLIQQKVSSFTSSGTQNNGTSNTSSGGGLYDF